MDHQQKTTRIPAFLWDALQDVLYEQDHEFLRMVAPHIGVSLSELKRTLLGARGQRTTVAIADTALWWEGELCPMRDLCVETGVWKSCGRFREAHGLCGDHRCYATAKSTASATAKAATAKHKHDPYFAGLIQRTPWRYNGDIVWVGPDDVLDAEGRLIPGLQIRQGVLVTTKE
jgi:hypothetical protein